LRSGPALPGLDRSIEKGCLMTEFDDLEFSRVDVFPTPAAQVAGESASDPDAVARAVDKAFAKLFAFVKKNGLSAWGAPRALYTECGPERTKFIVAVPILKTPGEPIRGGSAYTGELAGGSAYRFTHRGSYGGLAATYDCITRFMTARGLMAGSDDWDRYMPMWEEYANNPAKTPEDDLLTYIYLPRK